MKFKDNPTAAMNPHRTLSVKTPPATCADCGAARVLIGALCFPCLTRKGSGAQAHEADCICPACRVYKLSKHRL